MTAPEPRRRKSNAGSGAARPDATVNDPAPLDDPRLVEPLGGADAVEKTTYTAPSGSDPADDAGTDPVATARVRSQPFGPLTWAAIVLALLVMLAYGIGLFR